MTTGQPRRNVHPEHYCGRRHNPRYPCPSPEWEPGGVPLSLVRERTPCECEGIDHAETCGRRRTIELLEMRRNRGHH